jgi:multidrug transporter EmrE-like cation transporter
MHWLFAAIFCQSAAVAFAKQAALSTSSDAIHVILLSPYYLASLVMLAVQAVCWIFVVKRFPLSVAYPVCSLSIVLNLLFAVTLFHEPFGLRHIAGAALIVVGVFFLYAWPGRART